MTGDPDHKLCSSFLAAMGVLAKPWNGLLITVLVDGPLRFGEISASMPSIGDRMLASRLKELEDRGVLVRRVDPGPPVRVSYELTEAGRGFGKVVEAISAWGRTLERAQPAAAPKRRRAAE